MFHCEFFLLLIVLNRADELYTHIIPRSINAGGNDLGAGIFSLASRIVSGR